MDKLEVSTSEISTSLEEIINSEGFFPLCISGTSMHPFLISGKDSVRLRKFGEHDCKKGEILLFRRSNGALVLHRIKKVLPDGRLLMNGDAQVWCETVNRNCVMATVSSIEKNGRIIPCTSLRYRAQVFLWRMLFPVRPLLIRVCNKIIQLQNNKEN